MSFINPVQHKIPSGYDFKNVNVVNFKGINCSENVLDNKTSGCKDCLNLYVNENNILAVRPRLQHDAKLNYGEIIKVDSLGINEMVYLTKQDSDNDEFAYKYTIIISDKNTAGFQEEDKIITTYRNDLLEPCTFFRTGDGTLLCTSDKGFYIVDLTKLTFREVEQNDAYIPTTEVNLFFGDPSSGELTIEEGNLLTNKEHKEYNVSWTDQTILKQDLPEDIDISNFITTSDATNSTVDEINNDDYTRSVILSDEESVYQYQVVHNASNCANIEQIFKTGKEDAFWEREHSNNDCASRLPNIPGINDMAAYIKSSYSYNTFAKKTAADSTDYIMYPQITEANFLKTKGYVNDIDWVMPIEVLVSNEKKLHIKLLTNTEQEGIDMYAEADDLYDSITETYKESTLNNCTGSVSVMIHDNLLMLTMLVNVAGGTSQLITMSISLVQLEGYLTQETTSIEMTYDAKSVPETWPTTYGCHIADRIADHSGGVFYLIANGHHHGSAKAYITYFGILQYSSNIQPEWFVAPTKEEVVSTTNVRKYKLIKLSPITYGLMRKTISRGSWIDPLIDYCSNDAYNTSDLYFEIDLLGNCIVKKNSLLENAWITPIANSSWLYIRKYVDGEGIHQYLTTNFSKDSAIITLPNISDAYDGSMNSVYDDVKQQLTLYVTDYINTTRKTWTLKVNKDRPTIIVTIEIPRNYKHDFSKVRAFDNKFFFYGSTNDKNLIRWTYDSKLLYIPVTSERIVGKKDDITNILQLNNQQLGIFKQDETNILVRDSETGVYLLYTLKTPKGCIGSNQAIVIPTTNIPMVITDDSVCIVQQGSNNVLEDAVFTTLSADIFEKFSTIKNKEKIKTHIHGMYIYCYYVENDITQIWVLDCRDMSWFKWEIPLTIIDMYESETTLDNASETETRVITSTDEYTLTSSIHSSKTDGEEDPETYVMYIDDLGDNLYRRIPWFWISRILPLGTVNYLKKITNLQLIFSDKSKEFEYDISNGTKQSLISKFTKNNAMFYELKTYRKKSSFLDGDFVGELDGVGIQRLKIRLPKCDFAELKLSNYKENNNGIQGVCMFSDGQLINLEDEDDIFLLKDGSNIQNTIDRLHLAGITFKILLSEGVN